MFPFISSGQIKGRLLCDIDTPSASMYSDFMDNIYVITPNQTILKYDSKGTFLNSYKSKGLGNISSLDASNPESIYVFYKDDICLQVLDKEMNPISKIDLSSTFPSGFGAGCKASQGGYWIFDNSDKDLKHLNNNLKIDKKTHVLGERDESLGIYEGFSKLYVILKSSLIVFDMNGRYLYSSVMGYGWAYSCKEFYLIKDDEIHIDGLSTEQIIHVTLPPHEKDANIISIGSRKFVIRKGNHHQIYKY